ncbi:hypothetical protein C478_10693 [Natrinema thermotolerans DSM 11552]|nr:hypothetical protein C478_10693 [Natrinema thermotolerans DSM 11552]
MFGLVDEPVAPLLPGLVEFVGRLAGHGDRRRLEFGQECLGRLLGVAPGIEGVGTGREDVVGGVDDPPAPAVGPLAEFDADVLDVEDSRPIEPFGEGAGGLFGPFLSRVARLARGQWHAVVVDQLPVPLVAALLVGKGRPLDLDYVGVRSLVFQEAHRLLGPVALVELAGTGTDDRAVVARERPLPGAVAVLVEPERGGRQLHQPRGADLGFHPLDPLRGLRPRHRTLRTLGQGLEVEDVPLPVAVVVTEGGELGAFHRVAGEDRRVLGLAFLFDEHAALAGQNRDEGRHPRDDADPQRVDGDHLDAVVDAQFPPVVRIRPPEEADARKRDEQTDETRLDSPFPHR